MDFKKLALATMVATALTGCNSGSDSSSGGGGGAGGGGGGGGNGGEAPVITAIFSDVSPVEGASFNCGGGSETGETNQSGEFKVTSGLSCIMSIDGFSLGMTQPISSQNTVINSLQLQPAGITPARRASQSSDSFSHAARVSSLLQSIDANPDDRSKIDTTKTDGGTIPEELFTADISDDDDFKKLLGKIENDGVPLPPGNMVPPSEAEDELRGGYESERAREAISKIIHLVENLTTENIEVELNSIRSELEASDNSNGYHQEALLALIEILEVVNIPEVANRIDITGNPFDYSEMLPKVLDATFNRDAEVLFKGSQGSTDDISEILFESAQRLINASQRLGSAMPDEDSELPYEGTEGFTYQDSLVARAYALNIANAISTISAYQLGDDTFYVPQEIKDPELKIVEGWYDSSTEKFETRETTLDFEGDYVPALVDPVDFAGTQGILELRSDTKYLSQAKQALTDSIPVINAIELDDPEEADKLFKFMGRLEDHLNAEDGDAAPFVIENNGEKTYVNLHAFYNVESGISRSSFDINANGYDCRLGNYHNFASKVFSDSMCLHNDEDITNEYEFDWRKVTDIGYRYDEDNGRYIDQVIPAIYARENITITPREDQIIRVVWCGEEDGQKVSCFADDA